MSESHYLRLEVTVEAALVTPDDRILGDNLCDVTVAGFYGVPAVTTAALLRLGEPMVTENPGDVFPYRAWLRWPSGGRAFGAPAPTVRLAAENLLAKVRG